MDSPHIVGLKPLKTRSVAPVISTHNPKVISALFLDIGQPYSDASLWRFQLLIHNSFDSSSYDSA